MLFNDLIYFEQNITSDISNVKEVFAMNFNPLFLENY